MGSDDNPVDALTHQFELEDSSISPTTKIFVKALSAISGILPWPLDKIISGLKDRLAADAGDRMKVMIETAIGELRRHDSEIQKIKESLSKQDAENRERVAQELLIDAARKAGNTRSIERVKRIGIILANAIIESKPLDGDEVEEMMRVATEFDEEDARYLAELVRIEGAHVPTTGMIARLDAHKFWENGFWWGPPNSQTESVFRKLESYGLVATIPPPNSLNIMANIPTRFALLAKGLRFARLIGRK